LKAFICLHERPPLEHVLGRRTGTLTYYKPLYMTLSNEEAGGWQRLSHPVLHLLDQQGLQAKKAVANKKLKMISVSDRENPLISGYVSG